MRAIPRELRLFGLAVLGAAAVAVVITVIVGLAGREPAPPPQTKADLAAAIRGLDVNDLQFPSDFITVWKRQWYPSRPRLTSWTWDQVTQYWIDPRESALRAVSEQNDTKMRALFERVP